MSKSAKSRPPTSDETRKKLSIAAKNSSSETREKISKANKGRKFHNITCPHCKKLGGKNVMYRWHFNNCKLKPNGGW